MPNFMLLGAAKAGTTSLHYYLNQHPQIFLPKEKELQFFTDDKLYAEGKEYYLKHYFSGAHLFPARGEATPFYLHRSAIVIPRLKEFFSGRIKFIVMLRDPVSRAWSHYQHMVRLGHEHLTFEDALLAETDRLREQPTSWFSYFSDGLYAHQLEQWFEHYPQVDFLILKQDEMMADAHELLGGVFSFLEVDANITISDLSVKNEAGAVKNKLLMEMLMGRAPGSGWVKKMVPTYLRRRWGMKLRQLNTKPAAVAEKMLPGTAEMLRKAYDADLALLERQLGLSFSSWRED